ncbi:MAG TPA: LuxR C-terminal-related transcriptional regulator [Gaiellaceae bacterium]|nr:LuxR C-terminal-related transcriptional regulator [Gaiellaceae bacterium]
MDGIAEAERRFDLGRIRAAHGETARALEYLDEALLLARGADRSLEAAIAVERAKLGLSDWDPERALTAAREAAAAASRAGKHIAAARVVLAHALYVALDEGATTCFRRARREARDTGDVDTECEAAAQLAASLQAFGHARSALEAAETARRLARRRGKRRWEAMSAWLAARTRAFTFGDYERGIPALVALLSSRALGETRTHLRVDLAVAYAQTGRAEEGRAALARARRFAADPFSRWLVAWAEAELHRAAGRPERALAAIEGARVESGPVDAVLERCRLWALLDLGRTESATAPPTHPWLAGAGMELRAFAALAAGRNERAAELFDAAATMWHDNILYCSLEARWLALELRGRPVDELLELERRVARHGMEPILARVRRSLAARDRGRGAAGSPQELSLREQEVLELVAGGLTSGQIAERLGLARSTVETHVRGAMAKLGARTRLQAARASAATAQPSIELPDEARELLDRLADGATVVEAARALGISRRTATRRLAAVRAGLGVSTNAQAMSMYGGGPARVQEWDGAASARPATPST